MGAASLRVHGHRRRLVARTYQQILAGKYIGELALVSSELPSNPTDVALTALTLALADDPAGASHLLERIPGNLDEDTMGLVLETRSIVAAANGEPEERVCEIAEQAVTRRPRSVFAFRMLGNRAGPQDSPRALRLRP